MVTHTPQTFPQETNNIPLVRLWNSLTQPADHIIGDARRRAKSLSALLLVFFPLAIITVFLTPLQDILRGQSTSLNTGGVVGIIIITIAYFISRTKYFQIAAYITVAIPFVAVTTAILRSEVGLTESSLVFMSLSVILSSLLLTSRDTVVTGASAIAILIALFTTIPDQTINPTSIITYTLVATGVMALISRIRENNLKALQLAQSQLKEQFIQAEAARERAERSDQVKSAFLASMSHELRTPLNAIINFTRFVSKGTLGPVNEEQVETLDNVIISGKHLLNLINDVLDMAKIESGSLTLFISDDVSINEIVSEVSVTGRALIDDKPIELKTRVEDNLPDMRGDHQRIRQILLNIISNACKFTDEGSITISAKQDADDIVIAIADTGRGIAQEDQAMVFEAFKQTNDGLRQGGGGTGLGMPITKNLIEAHGGSIQLDSEPGQGSTFSVRLPIKSNTLTPTLVTEI